MASSRRRLLQLAGGTGVGLLFTPAPWRLVGDSALWTQNWSWVPKTPRGELTERRTFCTLCPSACAVRARCAGGMPTGLWPASEPLCPAGFVAHHLAFHPQRLRAAGNDKATGAVEALRQRIEELKARRSPERVAVLDLAPGRTASLIHGRLLAGFDNGVYLAPPQIEGATASAVADLLAKRAPLALDLARAKTLLSIGTPVAEGWGSPKRVAGRRRSFRLIHADSQRSHTADVADECLEIQPGSELTLLLAIARQLIDDGRESPAARQCPDFDEFRTAVTAVESGIAPERLRELARALVAGQPSAVVADGDPANGPYSRQVQAAAAALNALLGSVGTPGGYAPRAEIPAPSNWAGVPATSIESLEDGSVSVLIIDEPLPGASLPWALMERKLSKDALVAACTWSAAGVALRARWLIPAPVFLEAVQDAPPAADSVDGSFRVSDTLLPAPSEAMDAVALVGRLLGEETSLAQALEERTAAIHASGRGMLTKAGEADAAPVKSVAASAFWTSLREGGYWREDNPPDGSAKAVRLLPAGLNLRAAAARTTERTPGWRQASVSPLLSKLWQESELKVRPGAPLPS